MAEKHHPTLLSGGDHKALKKELAIGDCSLEALLNGSVRSYVRQVCSGIAGQAVRPTRGRRSIKESRFRWRTTTDGAGLFNIFSSA
jgi:hypothetical protein